MEQESDIGGKVLKILDPTADVEMSQNSGVRDTHASDANRPGFMSPKSAAKVRIFAVISAMGWRGGSMSDSCSIADTVGEAFEAN
jgi:hypothetical protein